MVGGHIWPDGGETTFTLNKILNPDFSKIKDPVVRGWLSFHIFRFSSISSESDFDFKFNKDLADGV